MLKIPISICLLLTVSAAHARSSTSCSSYFGTEDKQIIESSEIADPVVLRNVLNDIASAGFTPDVQEKMAACAFERHHDASLGLASAPTAPQNFAPTITQQPTPMVTATGPNVVPMQNAAPSQLQQNGQTLMNAGQQMMMMGDIINNQVSQAADQNAAKAITLAESQSANQEDSPTIALQIGNKAEDFVRGCSALVNLTTLENKPSFSALTCGMYVEGVAAGAAKYPGALKILVGTKIPQKLCIPADASSPQRLISAVLHFIETHPQTKDDRTGDVAVVALLLAFPCK